MFIVKIAEFNIKVDNKYSYVEKLCKDYIVNTDSYDIFVNVTDEEIQNEKSLDSESSFSDAYCESVCIYRKICLELVKYDAFLFHSAVIEVDGAGYAFSAKSGTGKSTHIGLWKKYFGEKVKIINGDKPILKFIDNDIYVYGTPWAGKENWQRNVKAPLKTICFIERGTENSIRKMTSEEAVIKVANQVLMPKEKGEALKMLDMLDKLLKKVSLWNLKCNISKEAAELSYTTLTGDDISEN